MRLLKLRGFMEENQKLFAAAEIQLPASARGARTSDWRGAAWRKSQRRKIHEEDLETLSALARHIAVGINSHHLLAEVKRKAEENQHLYDGLRAIYKETVRAFAAAIDMKDRYTQGHSVRVGKYSEVIAREMGWTDDEVEGITIAGYLHDIGN
jgi:HD-GYP domain-containing protein (c-di-GMP phosphodiesterase class II)